MSEAGKVRLVRCPKCQNLLTELPAYSVYQCGACATLLTAREKDSKVDMLSENLEEERAGGGVLEKFSDSIENSEYVEKPVMNSCDESGNDIRSNGTSARSLERKEIIADRAGNYRNSSMSKGDKEVVEIIGEMNENGNDMDKESADSNPWIGKAGGSRGSGRLSDWRATSERGETEQFLSNQRADVEGLRYLTSKYSEEIPANHQPGSIYDHSVAAERMKNQNDIDALKKVEYLEQDRTELLRKLDELKDQLSRTKMVENPKEKVPMSGRVAHQDPYGGLDNWFTDGSFGQKRTSLQYAVPDKHVAGPSYTSRYVEPPPFTNSREMSMHSFYTPMHTPSQLPGFEDPFRSQMLRTHTNQAPHHLQQPTHQYFPVRYMNNDMVNFDMIHPYSHNLDPHTVSCSCLHCYNKYPRVPKQNPPSAFRDRRLTDTSKNLMFYHREHSGGGFGVPDYNPGFASRDSHNPHLDASLANDLDFKGGVNRQRHPRVVLATGAIRCRPVAGGAPFIACYNCLEVLQLPKTIFKTRKSQKKFKCAACSKVILLIVADNKLVFTLGDGVKEVPSKVDSSPSMVAKEDSLNYQGANWGSMDLSSDDYENTGYDFQSMDQKLASSTTGLDLSSNQSVDMRSLHSTVSCTSEDEDKLDALIGTREEAKSDEVVVETENTRPPSGSPLQDHFDYSGKCNMVNRVGKGNRSGRSEHEKVIIKKVASRQISMKDASVATELDISANEYGNTGVIIDSGNTGKEEDQLRVKKGGSSFFVGIIKKSFKDKSRCSQNIEQERINVAVNGHPIPDRLVKKAEKVAGLIQPGQYWYDSRAGFWGLIGGPCLGIIPPNIEEFAYPMPEDCAGGNTGVYVNGRELHQKDLILLGNRGLPTERDRSYIIEMSGRVLDEDSGEELDSLGKLAPTVEKLKHGFGMKPSRPTA
ncbi:Protein ENHANCED DISEASE RESISTANCE like [Heracleum sosnowskyi]|uniref:Protein ENHANCED DISEASE RESISTANCE like n=1 Tax=Heracleum sosnowskyi TaxID=360622 RepID=A0AAD8I041_9APIA|nr:Protein ENHANCED DISEASE RESISTANCE like [Heracleum sosnowskyi]